MRGRPLIARKCEDLVVIHDGVQGLNPHRIDVAIEENPLGSFALEVRNVPHDARKQAVLPLLVLSGGEICKHSFVFSERFSIDLAAHNESCETFRKLYLFEKISPYN